MCVHFLTLFFIFYRLLVFNFIFIFYYLGSNDLSNSGIVTTACELVAFFA